MESQGQREVLAALIRDRGEDFASLSRLLGRNPAYVQQFIKRGVPRKLDEADRRLLADYFGIADEVLGGPAASAPRMVAAERSGGPKPVGDDFVLVPRLAVGASAGPGAVAGDERATARMAFRADWLRDIVTSTAGLSIIQVKGDSMFPTLADGDDILVDRSDAADRLRDGIYVLRAEDVVMVKRIAIAPSGRGLIVKSDNPAYPDWTDRDAQSIDLIGRVVWAGRRVV
jgi:hypothetical protein